MNTANTRVQLTLFVPSPAAELVESVRRLVDPIQHRLIPAHVTLCREDELERLGPELLKARLANVTAHPLTLRFGRPESFHDHGILLPCIDGHNDFRALREHLLGRSDIRDQTPHITLAHPRNAKAEHNDLGYASAMLDTLTITFREISRIEQHGTSPWVVLDAADIAYARNR